MHVEQCQIVNKMPRDAKASYYSSIISENASDPKILFSTMDKLLHRKVERRFPSAPSKTELVNNFIQVFDNKITTITEKSLCNELISTTPPSSVEKQISCTEFKKL
jgi:hypothetical protein